ncbi:MAG: tetratricopeptide repeat protein [Bacteroidota bacterium]
MEASQEDLVFQAWNHLELEEYEEAEKLASSLMKLPEEAGFRIQSMIWVARENEQKALEVLEQGLTALPNEWHLWLQYGNMLSQVGRFEEALESFDNGLATEPDQPAWLYLNQAVVYFRQGQIDEALTLLQSIDDPAVITEAFSLQLSMLDQVDRHDLILEIATDELEILPVPETMEEASKLSQICSQIANAAWYEDKSKEEVFHYLRQSISFDRTNPQAIWLWREAYPEFIDSPKEFQLLVQGRFQTQEGQEEQSLFLTTYALVAGSTDHALRLIQAYEIEEVNTETLEILEVEEGESESAQAVGIYEVGGFGILDPDENV